MATSPEDQSASGQAPTPPSRSEEDGGKPSGGINIGGNASVENVVVHGPVIGRDYVVVTEDQSLDVSDVPGNPYRGLASFTYAERAAYGGRDAQIQDAVALLTTPGEQRSLLLVTGASGSGKSSFVQAGLLPALETFYAAHGSRQVRFSVMRPGRVPVAALAQAVGDLGLPSDAPLGDALARTPIDRVHVLVIDQFEEVFTQSESAQREALCAQLSALPAFDVLRTHVLLTLRSDYLGSLFGIPPLYELSKHSSIELRAMTATELAEAIRKPLDEVNRQRNTLKKRWDPALVQRLTEDVASDATLLPLLQVTLTSLWEDPPRKLVLGRYRNLTAALQSTADRVYAQDARGRARSQAELDTIMGIFLDLVEVSMDDDPRRDVRRTMPRLALVRDRPERGPLIDELVDKRLLSSTGGLADEARIDIIHETLLTNWSALEKQIARQRAALQSRERFLDARREWLDHDRSDDYRLQGIYLAEARALVADGDIATADADSRAFIERSVALAEQERQRELDQARALAAEQQARADDSARAARRLRRWLVAVVVTAVLAVTAAVVAAFGFVSANQQARINASRELAAQSETQLATDPELAILLAREAEARVSTQQADEALRQALVRSPLRRVLNGPGAALNGLALSADGALIAASGLDGTVRVWNAASGALASDFRAQRGPIAALGFAADARTILTASADDPFVRLWGASNGAPVAQLNSAGAGVASAIYSPGGRYIAAGTTDGKVQVWDARSYEPVADLAPLGPMPVVALAFSADEARLALGGLDGSARIWPFLAGGDASVLRGHLAPVSVVAFSSAGDRVLTASVDGTARLWDATGGAEQVLKTGTGPHSAAALSPDGRVVVTADLDGRAWLWAADDGHQLAELRGHSRRVSTVAFSPSGGDVLTTSDDGTARLWDVSSGTAVLTLRGHDLPVSAGQFSRDGRTVVTASFDKSVRVWQVDQTPAWTVVGSRLDHVLGVAFSSDGRRLATASQDNAVRLWEPGRPTELARRELPSAASSVVFSPDGSRLAFALWDGTAHVLGGEPDGAPGVAPNSGSTAPGAPAVAPNSGSGASHGDALARALGGAAGTGIALRGHSDWVYSVAFSPDGGRVLTAGRDRSARIWNAATGEPLGQLDGHQGDVTSAAWDPSARRIVTSSSDRSARIWNADTFTQTAELRGHTDGVRRAIFSPDGRQVVTASLDATLRVWDATSGSLSTTLRRHTAAVLGLAFTADGSLLATSSADRTVLTWDTRTWQAVAELRGAADDVNDLAFSPDAQRLAAASGDGHVRIYAREQFAPLSEVLSLSLSRVTRQPPALTSDERARFVQE